MELQPRTLDMSSLFQDIRKILQESRQNVAIQVNVQLLNTYWNIGRVIIEFEQKNHIRAEYGAETLTALAKALTAEFGKGFSKSNLYNMRQFYITHKIFQSVTGKLSWTHQCELLTISDDAKRNFYEKEAVNANWSVWELK